MISTSKDSAKRIARVVRRDEKRPYNETGDKSSFDAAFETMPVKITSTTQTAGRYPGTLYKRDGSTDTFTQLSTTAGDIWVDTPNGESLSTDTYYYARKIGVRAADNKLIFEVFGTRTFDGARLYLQHQYNYGSGSLISTWARDFDIGGYTSGALSQTWFTITTTAKYLLTASLGFINDGTLANTTVSVGLTDNTGGPICLAGGTAPRGNLSSINGAVSFSHIENIAAGQLRGIYLKESGGNATILLGSDFAGPGFGVFSHFAITRL